MSELSRIRIRYHKNEGLRYTGSLDMQRIWERGLRRAGLPVAYSQGFHPQPRIQQACPLPLGFLSNAEIVDIWLNQPEVDTRQVQSSLVGCLPEGIQLQSVEPVELYSPALQALTRFSDYSIELLERAGSEDLSSRAKKLLEATSLPRERRGKPYDLRPLILELQVIPDEGTGAGTITMRLAAAEGATGRPEEVLLELGRNPIAARITRTALGFSMPELAAVS